MWWMTGSCDSCENNQFVWFIDIAAIAANYAHIIALLWELNPTQPLRWIHSIQAKSLQSIQSANTFKTNTQKEFNQMYAIKQTQLTIQIDRNMTIQSIKYNASLFQARIHAHGVLT